MFSSNQTPLSLWPMPASNRTNHFRLFQSLMASARVFKSSHPKLHLAIRWGIAKATSLGVDCIVVITDSLSSAKKALDPPHHSGQGESIAIVHLLRPFFNRNSSNRIEFWYYSSKARWHLHAIVDDDAKSTIVPSTPSQFTSSDALRDKSSKACTDQWITIFNHGHNKGHQFLQLKINKKKIQPLYIKGGGWPNLGSSVSLCARTTRGIKLRSYRGIQEEILSSK